jgi:hypothetical protein
MSGRVLQMYGEQDLESTFCPQCGVIFASNVVLLRRKDGADLYCPNGHVMSWRGRTDADRLRTELDAEKQKRFAAEREREWALVQKREVETQKAKVERKLKLQTKRVNAGVCPHCNRTFSQLARHMQCKHAEIVKEPS